MTDELVELIEKARRHQMADEERDEQAVSFVYGNLAIEGPTVTREAVREAVREALARVREAKSS